MLDNVRNRPGYTSWIRVRHLLSKQTDGGAGPLAARPAQRPRNVGGLTATNSRPSSPISASPPPKQRSNSASVSACCSRTSTGIICRFDPANNDSPRARIRYNDLLATPGVAEALARHGVTPAGPDPEPAPALPPGLLADLVGQLGLTTFDVELLTGRRRTAVLRDLKAPR